MRKRMIRVLFALLLCLSLSLTVFANGTGTGGGVILDEADLLSDSEEALLAAKMGRVSQTHGAELVIITVSSTDGADIDELLEYLYDSMGFGYGPERDGVLLLVSMAPREYRILSNGFAGVAIDVDTIDAIGEDIVPDLSAGEYADAFGTFVERCDYYLNGYLNGFPFDFVMSFAVSLVIGAVVGVVVAFILKGQLKTVRRQNQAHAYVKPGSMQVTVHNDFFLYRNVTRTKKETSSGSSSKSGSSRSTGGGSF